MSTGMYRHMSIFSQRWEGWVQSNSVFRQLSSTSPVGGHIRTGSTSSGGRYIRTAVQHLKACSCQAGLCARPCLCMNMHVRPASCACTGACVCGLVGGWGYVSIYASPSDRKKINADNIIKRRSSEPWIEWWQLHMFTVLSNVGGGLNAFFPPEFGQYTKLSGPFKSQHCCLQRIFDFALRETGREREKETERGQMWSKIGIRLLSGVRNVYRGCNGVLGAARNVGRSE